MSGNIQTFAFLGYDPATHMTIPLAYGFWLQQTASRVVTAPGTVDKTNAITWFLHEFSKAVGPSIKIRVLTADKCYSTHRAWLTFVIGELAAASALVATAQLLLTAVHGNAMPSPAAIARVRALLNSIGASAPLSAAELGDVGPALTAEVRGHGGVGCESRGGAFLGEC